MCVYESIYLSLYPSFYLSLSLTIHMCVCVCLCVCVCICVNKNIHAPSIIYLLAVPIPVISWCVCKDKIVPVFLP